MYRLRIDEAVILNTLHGAWIEKASEIRIRSFDTVLELQLREGKKMCQVGLAKETILMDGTWMTHRKEILITDSTQ